MWPTLARVYDVYMEGTPVTVRLDQPTLATVDDLIAASDKTFAAFAKMPKATRSDVIRMMVTNWISEHRRDIATLTGTPLNEP